MEARFYCHSWVHASSIVWVDRSSALSMETFFSYVWGFLENVGRVPWHRHMVQVPFKRVRVKRRQKVAFVWDWRGKTVQYGCLCHCKIVRILLKFYCTSAAPHVTTLEPPTWVLRAAEQEKGISDFPGCSIHQKRNSMRLDTSDNSFMTVPQSAAQCLSLSGQGTVAYRMDSIQEAFGKSRMKTLLDLVSASSPHHPPLAYSLSSELCLGIWTPSLALLLLWADLTQIRPFPIIKASLSWITINTVEPNLGFRDNAGIAPKSITDLPGSPTHWDTTANRSCLLLSNSRLTILFQAALEHVGPAGLWGWWRKPLHPRRLNVILSEPLLKKGSPNLWPNMMCSWHRLPKFRCLPFLLVTVIWSTDLTFLRSNVPSIEWIWSCLLPWEDKK